MASVDEQVIDFYYDLFDRVFTQPFNPKIKERLRRDAVARQVQEAAGAASQALTRFFNSEQLSEERVGEVLQGFSALLKTIQLEDIANPNRPPEALVDALLARQSFPKAIAKAGLEPVYRVALHQTVQVLMLVGPVMMEWQKLSFSSTYEMPRRIVSQLNQITEGLKALSSAGQDAVDERFELTYRDHLLQRFYRVEAGTVRMTTNLNVDLRELFVMPHIAVRSTSEGEMARDEGTANDLMSLSAARAIFDNYDDVATDEGEDQGVPAIDQVRRSTRNVIVGTPGGGKSTLFEWLQLSLANVEEELIAGSGQAIPLLLRVRQLDPKNLPLGAELIEKATASRDRATLMPAGWIDRHMNAGRVLLMLDGLDESEPDIRDNYILPWLIKLCQKYPKCHYLVSSRPVGYPPGALRKLGFVECDLQDFKEPQIAEYTRHWCTAIRIAQNDPVEEARREGAREGDQIVTGFKDHPYIRNLARNPLMLSAICLVNYFEGGQLPKDRAVLYRLCVEGLLHHWDQRRGIQSVYLLDEKLRVCREVAIAMQADDRAEYEAPQVLKIIVEVLKDPGRSKNLLEHIRYRTGLLIERRAGVFAFAHLTFQEYLAARAIYEGNHLNIDTGRLAHEHADGRWTEVIALYCGLASAKAAQKMIEELMNEPDTHSLSRVLAEAFLSSNTELLEDAAFRKRVIERMAVCPYGPHLERFRDEEVAPIANYYVGRGLSENTAGESFRWLIRRPKVIDFKSVMSRLRKWKELTPLQAYELFALVHCCGPDEYLLKIANDRTIYDATAPSFGYHDQGSQPKLAEQALAWLSHRERSDFKLAAETALLQSLRVLSPFDGLRSGVLESVRIIFTKLLHESSPQSSETWPEFVMLVNQMAAAIKNTDSLFSNPVVIAEVLQKWADRLSNELAQLKNTTPKTRKSDSPQRRRSSTTTKQATKRRAKP